MKPNNSSRSFLGSILFFIFLVIYTPLHAIAFLVLCPFVSSKKRQTIAFAWTTMCIRMLGPLCRLHYKLEGLEHLPSNTGGIIMAKHQSAWETLAIPSVLQPRPLCIVYKQELHYIPFFGWGLKMLNMAPINRSKGAAAFEQIKQAALQHLQNGAWMMFFPEGTRVPVGQTRKYKTGGARLALATGATIIPVALDAGEFWPRHGFWKRQGSITLRFGPPISPAGHTLESLNAAVETWIEGQMRLISPHRYEANSAHNTRN